ncbi:MAG: PASTA domain-containing protein [Endomicrobiales bacterium]|nr:PASTA domain-containing protein [Endomicrobiales bacterium]
MIQLDTPTKIKLALASMLGLIFLYFLGDWTLSGLIHARQEIMVPDLTGKSLPEAINVISEFNLGLRKDSEEFDDTIPQGTIIRQAPPAGMTVREGKIIRVVISQGGKMIFVPNVVGQSMRSAEIMIRSAGLVVGEESTRYSLKERKEYVLSQDPPSEATVEKDAMINLVISAGPPPSDIRLMPDFSDKNIEDVKKWSQENDIMLDILEETGTGVLPGTVIRQEPEVDTDISDVGRVSVTIMTADAGHVYSRTFHYEIPQGGGERNLRLVMLDQTGEKELFRGKRAPGTKLDIPVNPKGNARIRIFINNILVEEREIR